MEQCKFCFNDGIVRTRDSKGITRVYACACPLGEPNRRPMFTASDKEKKFPIVMPTYYGSPMPPAPEPVTPGLREPISVNLPRLPYNDD